MIDNFEYFFNYTDKEFIKDFIDKINHIKENPQIENISFIVSTYLKYNLYKMEGIDRKSSELTLKDYKICEISTIEKDKEIERRVKDVSFLKEDDKNILKLTIRNSNFFYKILDEVFNVITPDSNLPKLIKKKQQKLISECDKKFEIKYQKGFWFMKNDKIESFKLKNFNIEIGLKA